MSSRRAALLAAVTDVGRLVLPVECPGCGHLDTPLCAACAAALTGRAARCEAAVPRLDRMDGTPPPPVWAVAAYVGPVRGVVVAWKDRGRADLTRPLVAALERAGRDLAPALREVAAWGGLAVVPVPTTARARRRRGADLVRVLATGLARGLAAEGVPAVVAPVLGRRRDPRRRDQVGLGARSRARNAAGSVTARSDVAAGRVVLLVDDVVTTGATLAACRVALEAAGALVVGAVVLAATPSPSGSPSEPSSAAATPSPGAAPWPTARR